MSISLSTHVLDTGAGRPADAVRVERFQGDERLGSGQTDGDGRVSELASGLAPGAYRLVFHPPPPSSRGSSSS